MKLLKWLEDRTYDLRLRWIDKTTAAEIDYTNGIVRINLQLVLTELIAHEFLHDCFPCLSERKILRKTVKYLNRMKVSEIKAVGKETFRQLILREVERRIR